MFIEAGATLGIARALVNLLILGEPGVGRKTLAGWVLRDLPTHDAAATERHWQTLLDLLAKTLPR